MKVLIIPEFGEFGGTLTFFKQLVEIHFNNKFESAVLIQNKQYYPDMQEYLRSKGLKVYLMPNRNKHIYKSYLAMVYELLFGYRAISDFKPDLIHISCGGPGNMHGYLFLNIPVVFTQLTNPFGPLRFGRDWVTRTMTGPKKIFTADSRHSVGKLVDIMQVPPEYTEVIYNSCSVPIAPASQMRPVIMTMGYIEEYKNPELWFHVARRVLEKRPYVKFIWLGKGTLMETIQNLIKKYKLSDSFDLPGYCSNVGEYLMQGGIYFHPSRLESHGIAAVEAMSYGLPCVTSNAGGLIESVIEGETGYICDIDDTDAYVNRLLELLDDPMKATRMGLAGRQRVIDFFGYKTQEQKFLQLYKKVLNSNK